MKSIKNRARDNESNKRSRPTEEERKLFLAQLKSDISAMKEDEQVWAYEQEEKQFWNKVS